MSECCWRLPRTLALLIHATNPCLIRVHPLAVSHRAARQHRPFHAQVAGPAQTGARESRLRAGSLYTAPAHRGRNVRLRRAT